MPVAKPVELPVAVAPVTVPAPAPVALPVKKEKTLQQIYAEEKLPKDKLEEELDGISNSEIAKQKLIASGKTIEELKKEALQLEKQKNELSTKLRQEDLEELKLKVGDRVVKTINFSYIVNVVHGKITKINRRQITMMTDNNNEITSDISHYTNEGRKKRELEEKKIITLLGIVNLTILNKTKEEAEAKKLNITVEELRKKKDDEEFEKLNKGIEKFGEELNKELDSLKK